MQLFRLFARFSAWRRQGQLESDLAEEIETHRSLKQAEHERDGLSPAEARAAAQRSMGNATLMAEDARSVWLAPWIESLTQDLRYGLRGLFRNPSFSLTAILSFGLAIGFNTSFFTIFNAVVLRPWPVLQPDRVFTVWSLNPNAPARRAYGGFGPVEARFLAESAESISGLLIQRGEQVQIGDTVGKPRSALAVTGNYFRLLGVPMVAGRGFLDSEDDLADPQAVAVISHSLWTSHFGSDPALVGKNVRINGVPFTITGIVASEFAGTVSGSVEIFLPFSTLPLISTDESGWARNLLHDPNSCCASIAIRLAPGASRDQAQAELASLHSRFLKEHTLDSANLTIEHTAFMSPSQARKVTPVFALFFLAVTIVLILACANVANLTLARAAARQRELGIRLSIGASRARVVRQLLTESLLVALAGGALGIGIAYWLPGVIFEYGIRESLSLNLRPDALVLTYTLAIAAAATLLSGLAPALHATRAERTRLIHGGSSPVTSRFSLRGVMLGAQVALSVVLLAGAFLLLRATDRARSIDLGFRVDGVQAAQVMLPMNTFKSQQVVQFVDSLDDLWTSRRLAATTNPPLSFFSSSYGVLPPGSASGAPEVSVQYLDVTPAYFDVLEIPIVRGRSFAAGDRSRHVLLVNQRLAERFWPARSPVGQFLQLGKESHEVVGVVRDAMTTGPGEVPITMYRPFTGEMPHLLWRQGDGDSAVWQSRLQRFDSRIRLETMSLIEARKRWLRGSELAFGLTSGLGAFALILAAIGIFGTFSFAVEQRRQEIGIRLSLGARTSQVIRAILVSSGHSVLAGLCLGLIAAAALSRLLDGQLYGLNPLDPISYLLVVAVLTAAAAIASWAPALRASRVDPVSSLRCD